MKRVLYLGLKGFTLIEMSVVLVILSVLIATGFSTVGSYLDNAHQSHTRAQLEVTKAALLNYVKVNKHMPCPDLNGDGRVTDPTDISGNRCVGHLGTVPFDELGIGRDVASDDFGNLFGYGVHLSSIDSTVMDLNALVEAEADILKTSPGSYFYANSAPVFELDTPPTELVPGVATDGFTVCKRTALDDCSGADDKELEYIPAVVVAFNVNGGVTDLNGCGTEARGNREPDNCDADMQLIKGVFREGDYDDQLVTISAYEIKQQVMDILNKIELTYDEGEYEGYEVIIRRDVDSANDLNVKSTGDNAFYVEGNFNANVTMSTGVDTLKVTGNVESGGAPKMGDGDDVLIVNGSVLGGSNTALGSGDDQATIGGVLAGDLKAGDGDDTVEIMGDVYGSVDMEDGNDNLTIEGSISGSVLMGRGDDVLTVNGLINVDIEGDFNNADAGVDELHVNQTEAEWNANGQEAHVSGFETVYFNDGTSKAL